MRNIITLLFVLLLINVSIAQIKGKITDNNNIPLTGVNVIIKGTQKGSETDFDGNFTIKNITGEQTLVISSIGYKTKEVKVTAPNNNVSVNLYEGNELLQEIEITSLKNNTFSRKKTAYVAKLPLKDMENANVYSTVTTELLESQIVTNLDEAMTNATGVYKLWEGTGRDPGNGTSFYSSRGFSVQPKLVDGIAGSTFSAVDPSYIERIETLKGPSATLFGSTETSLGGLINVVTKKPFKGTGGNITYTLGSFGLHRGSVDYNTPLGNGENIFFRVNTSYLTKESFQDAGFRKSFFIAPSLSFKVNNRFNVSLGMEFSKTKQTSPSMLFLKRGVPLKINNVKDLKVDPKKSFTSNDIFLENNVFNTRVIGDYKMSDQWTSQTVFSGTYAETEGDYQYQFDGGAGALASLGFINQQTTALVAQAQKAVDALANNPTSPEYIAAATQLATYKFVKSDLDKSLLPMLGEINTLLSRDAFTRVFERRNANATKFNIQQNFIGDFKIGDLRNRMVIGLDYLNKKDVNNNIVGNPNINSSPKLSELYTKLENYGFGKQATQFKNGFAGLPLFDGFFGADGSVLPTTFTPNASYNPNKASLDKAYAQLTPLNIKVSSEVLSAYISNVINIMPTLTLSLGARVDYFKQDGDLSKENDNYTKTTFSPSAGILFQPIQNELSLFANYQTGYVNNNPEITQSGQVINFAPSKAQQFEGGVKTNFFNGRLNLGASYYHITVNNYITSDPSVPLIGRSVDIAEAVSKGFELELNALPVKGLNVRASLSKNNMEYTKVYSKNAIVPGTEFKPVYGRNIVEYSGRRPVSAGPEMLYNFWADYQFPEESFAKNFGIGAGLNGASEQLTKNNAVSGTFTLPSYTLFNASLYYNADKFRIGVKANNFTDKIYYTGWSTINAQAPRSFLGTISYKF